MIEILTLLARKMIGNEVKEGDKIEVFYDKRIPGLNIRPKIEKEAIPTAQTNDNNKNTEN